VKSASNLKPTPHPVPNRLIRWGQECDAATCDLFSIQGMQNRAAGPLPARAAQPNERPNPLPVYWERQTNATLPPYGDEYAELEPHLYARCGANRDREVINGLAHAERQQEGKRGAEPGWLPDDELTRDWLQLMQQYRSECDASDRRRILNDPATGETAS
jgi:hypothetical protein